LPFLVPSFTVAMTIAAAVVVVELAAISWVRNRYMGLRGIQGTLATAFGVICGDIAGSAALCDGRPPRS
jgi:erythrin-vacuolar iron transport family protein